MKTKRIYLIIIFICLLNQSCNKIFPENMNTYVIQLKDSIYLDKPLNSIVIMDKINEDNFTVKGVIIDKIDSIYINNDKSTIYIVNNKNECIWVKSDFKTEKLDKKPKVNFVSITGYHD